jgi:hypothetical protein
MMRMRMGIRIQILLIILMRIWILPILMPIHADLNAASQNKEEALKGSTVILHGSHPSPPTPVNISLGVTDQILITAKKRLFTWGRSRRR